MDDMTAFERQVGEEIFRVVGPARPVDDSAVFETAATQSPKWRFRSMFSAAKLVVAGAISASASPEVDVSDQSVRSDLLPGVDLVTEEVEPGVYRVLSDGVRDLTRTGRSAFDMQRIYAGPDGSIWALWGDIGDSIPDRIESAAYRIGSAKDVAGLDD